MKRLINYLGRARMKARFKVGDLETYEYNNDYYGILFEKHGIVVDKIISIKMVGNDRGRIVVVDLYFFGIMRDDYRICFKKDNVMDILLSNVCELYIEMEYKSKVEERNQILGELLGE